MSTITEQIKERIDLVDLIREYLPELKKMGISWKARCPFHQEKTPSFVASPDKGIWHCFGCNVGGDVFGFIQKIEGLEFGDALRLLAERAGVKLEARDRQAESERGRLLDILRLSSRWYHQALLQSKSGEVARNYIQGRGLSDKIIKEWQLGFSPDAWDELLKYLQSRGYRDSEVAKTGLISSNNRGGYYDRFRYRLLFPIQDVHANVVGFTARKLREEDPSHKDGASVGGKYINTPETSLYHKSAVLYGLCQAKIAIRTAALAVVVEGNMDCIASHQAGITNVVAASGTALTPEQIKLLKRFTNTVCLAFDPDKAGQSALLRGLEVAWQEDMVVQVAQLPAGLDPDALIRKNPADWPALIAGRQNFMDWLFAKAGTDHDLTTGAGKKEAGNILLPWISRLPDAIEQTHYLQLLSRNINVGENVLRSVLEKRSKAARPTAVRRPSGTGIVSPVRPDKRPVLEQIGVRLLGLLLLHKDRAAFFQNFSLDWLANPTLVALYKSLNFSYDSHTPSQGDEWLASLPVESQTLAREALFIAEELNANFKPEEIMPEIAGLAGRLKQHYLQNKLNRIREQIKQAETSGHVAELQAHLDEWKKLSEDLLSI